MCKSFSKSQRLSFFDLTTASVLSSIELEQSLGFLEMPIAEIFFSLLRNFIHLLSSLIILLYSSAMITPKQACTFSKDLDSVYSSLVKTQHKMPMLQSSYYRTSCLIL